MDSGHGPSVPFFRPEIDREEIEEVVETLRSGWIGMGPKTEEFEERFAERVGAPEAVAVSSCTAALHLGLVCAGIGEGDEVITTPMTFTSTVNVIEHVGADPVLVDVKPDTLNLDPGRVEAAISQRTRAIIPVHYAGHPAEMDALEDIASRHDLLILEDAAHALGAAYRERSIGDGRNLAAFSFYSTKNITTAEGGMLTGPADILERARVARMHGMDADAWSRYSSRNSWYYEVRTPGYKYNMTDLQASLGLRQLEKLDRFQQRRREIAARYEEALDSLDGLLTPVTLSDVLHAWHLYVVRVRENSASIDRDDLIRELGNRDVGTSVHFIPVHLHPYYEDEYDYEPDDFPNALEAYREIVSLPLYPALTDDRVDYVVESIREIVTDRQRMYDRTTRGSPSAE